MPSERYKLLAAVIAEHPNNRVVGRTRLQKTIKLLQRLGLPTNYPYMLHFYGPYSEGVQAEIGVLEHFGLVKEETILNQEGRPYYVLSASSDTKLSEVSRFHDAIRKMSETDQTVLELAATYDAFREQGEQHIAALKMLREKKREKSTPANEEKAMRLLSLLGLSTQDL